MRYGTWTWMLDAVNDDGSNARTLVWLPLSQRLKRIAHKEQQQREDKTTKGCSPAKTKGGFSFQYGVWFTITITAAGGTRLANSRS
jgi:hypothetical protein